MELKYIIKKSNLQTKIINPLNFFVKGISIHSDQVRNNFIFAAMKGGSHHGLDFIKNLLSYKNIAVVLSKDDKIPKDLRNPILLMGGAGKPEHFVNTLKNDKISGIVTANLFNFLGTGLKEARNFSINAKIKLINFENIKK